MIRITHHDEQKKYEISIYNPKHCTLDTKEYWSFIQEGQSDPAPYTIIDKLIQDPKKYAILYKDAETTPSVKHLIKSILNQSDEITIRHNDTPLIVPWGD